MSEHERICVMAAIIAAGSPEATSRHCAREAIALDRAVARILREIERAVEGGRE